jgi:flagellin-like hook-associated protein FlgL
MQALSRVAFHDASDLPGLGEQVEHALRDLAGGEIAFETQVDGITDGQTQLSALPSGAAVGSNGQLTFTRADGSTVDVGYQLTDTLDALASNIAGQEGLDAELVDHDGNLRLRVYDVDGTALSYAETGGGDLLTTLGLPPSGAMSEGAIKRLADTHADIGSSQDILQRVRERLEETRLNVEQGITDIENVDVAKAMTELSGHRTTLESSYAVTARMSQLSLLNFLR